MEGPLARLRMAPLEPGRHVHARHAPPVWPGWLVQRGTMKRMIPGVFALAIALAVPAAFGGLGVR